MHAVINPTQTSARVWKTKAPGPPASPLYANEEINAYIAIRDELLAEAEETRSRTKLESLGVANEFVARCLKPARGPYQLQSLPASQAKAERQRCDVVRERIAVLRGQPA